MRYIDIERERVVNAHAVDSGAEEFVHGGFCMGWDGLIAAIIVCVL